MTTDDSFGARYDPVRRAAQVQRSLDELLHAPNDASLYITSNEALFLNYAEGLSPEMYCARIDEKWFVFSPYNNVFSGYEGPGALPVAGYPLMLADHSDALWKNGVLTTDGGTVCFTDTTFARGKLDGATALVAGGREYPILEVSFRDAGWILVTLDTADATPLAGAVLEVLR